MWQGRQYRITKILGWLCLCGMSTVAAQHSSTIIGRESLARSCYEQSMQASLSSQANRTDVQVCDRAIKDGALNASERAATYSNRGVIYMAMGDIKQAYQDYEKALEIDGQLAEAYINRGNLWFALQRYQRAINDYDKALEYDTQQHAIAYLNRGLSYESLNRLEQAKMNYQAALKVRSNWQAAVLKLERVSLKIRAQEQDAQKEERQALE